MRINREWIGVAFVACFFLAIFGLVLDAWVLQLAAVACFVLTWYSDVDPLNHTDPPGTTYMDRNGNPAGGPDLEKL